MPHAIAGDLLPEIRRIPTLAEFEDAINKIRVKIMSSTRAKFTVTQIIETRFGPQTEASYKTVILEPRYDQSIPEDVRFLIATPSGKMEMRIDNPPALALFIPGKAFYVDFTPAE